MVYDKYHTQHEFLLPQPSQNHFFSATKAKTPSKKVPVKKVPTYDKTHVGLLRLWHHQEGGKQPNFMHSHGKQMLQRSEVPNHLGRRGRCRQRRVCRLSRKGCRRRCERRGQRPAPSSAPPSPHPYPPEAGALGPYLFNLVLLSPSFVKYNCRVSSSILGTFEALHLTTSNLMLESQDISQHFQAVGIIDQAAVSIATKQIIRNQVLLHWITA